MVLLISASLVTVPEIDGSNTRVNAMKIALQGLLLTCQPNNARNVPKTVSDVDQTKLQIASNAPKASYYKMVLASKNAQSLVSSPTTLRPNALTRPSSHLWVQFAQLWQ
jgi:hypothetical protein